MICNRTVGGLIFLFSINTPCCKTFFSKNVYHILFYNYIIYVPLSDFNILLENLLILGNFRLICLLNFRSVSHVNVFII